MSTEARRCRRCLLREMQDENDYYRSVLRYRARLDARLRTPDTAYERRLAVCKQCGALQSAVCAECGCYVEMRAARADSHCPWGRW